MSYELHGYQVEFLASLAKAHGLGSSTAALQSVVERAMADPSVQAAIFDELQCIHCNSVHPADWIAYCKGSKLPLALALSAPAVAFLEQPLLLGVERIGEPPVKQLVPGKRSSSSHKAARCCIDWAVKEYGALETGAPTAVGREELQLTLAEIRSLLKDEPRALNLLVEANRKQSATTGAPESGATAEHGAAVAESTPPEAKAGGNGPATIPMAEVAKHNTKADFWFVIHGKVYDMTAYVSQHPGGFGVLNEFAGKVADEGFDGNHTPAVLVGQPDVKLIGTVAESELAEAAVAAAQEEAESAGRQVGFPEMADCLNTYDFEMVAQRRMKPQHMAYYATGASDNYTKIGNQDIFRRIELVPRVMMDMSQTDMAASLLGSPTSAPIYISACAKGGLADREGELALSRAAFAQGVIQMAPHFATRTLEEIAASRQQGQVQWLQIYVEKDRAKTAELVRRAEGLGYTGLFITVDSAGVSKNESDLRLTPGGNTTTAATTAAKRRWADDLTWEDMAWFRSLTSMKLVLKGVQSADDALLAYQHGLDGIVCSNHGGRRQDTARPTLKVLEEVMTALRAIGFRQPQPKANFQQPPGEPPAAPAGQCQFAKGESVQCEECFTATVVPEACCSLACSSPYCEAVIKWHEVRNVAAKKREAPQPPRKFEIDRRKFEVLVDGGVQRGSDVFKALALGADGVGIGRAALMGLAAFGQAGVERVLAILKEELMTTMQFMGTATLTAVAGARLAGLEHAMASSSWPAGREHTAPLRFPGTDC